MKKIFVLIAFAGIVGGSSAASLITVNKAVSITFRQDDKKKAGCKDHGHHDCSKHDKGKCHKGMSDSTKHCSKGAHGKKKCCKKGATPAVPPIK